MRLSHNGKIKLSARLRQMLQIWKLISSDLVWIWSTYLKELLIKCIDKKGFLKRETISAQPLQLMNLNFYWDFLELFHIWMGVSRLLLGQKMRIVCTVWVPSVTPYSPTCNPSFTFFPLNNDLQGFIVNKLRIYPSANLLASSHLKYKFSFPFKCHFFCLIALWHI